MKIHPTAIVDPQARLGEGVEIGPYSIIEAGVTIGDRTRVLAYAYLAGDTVIGPDCVIHVAAIIGKEAQMRNPSGLGGLTIGARNVIREHVTVHASFKPGERTLIGNDNFLLANSHVGHDCHVGDRTTIANGALLAGHVTIGDGAFVSGNVVLHQFVQVGKLAMLGGQSRVSKDVPPFMLLEGNSRIRGLNVVGMRRAGMTSEQRQRVKDAFRILYRSGLSVTNAVVKLRELPPTPETQAILDFIQRSKRGLCGGGSNSGESSVSESL